ncbi:MAG: amino acid permease [Pirellulales bacterium]|nr:amino acid permease [Pirellulales bacterium]
MVSTMAESASTRSTARLSLFDTVNLVIGIVVGVAIFKIPGTVFRNVETASQGLAAWLIGGVLSMMGALCFAELAATYPQSGGAYVYLRRAFGPAVSFLFGWGQLVAMITGTIGALAFVFADYTIDVFDLDAQYGALLAVGSVLVLTATNLAGVEAGKTTQNFLTLAKLGGLLAIAVSGFAMPAAASPSESLEISDSDIGFAMILILYAYGGWSDAAYVTAEVRDRQKNIALALILGVAAITVAYLLVNLALLRGLGFDGLRSSVVPATDLLRVNWGENAAKIMGVIVIISALGANNGVIFTGARVYVSLGSDHTVFQRLAKWNARQTAPTWSLLTQAAISILLITAVGTQRGQKAIDAALAGIGMDALPWSRFEGGFEMLLAATAPVFWLFLLLTIVALFVLRWREPEIERPFRVPLYPLPPLIFAATCGYMLYASVAYAGRLTALGLLPLALGGGVYLLEQRLRPKGG